MYQNIEDNCIDEFYSNLFERKKCVSELLKKVITKKQIQQEGFLRIVRKGKRFQYYLINNPKDTNGKYLPLSKISVAKNIAQRDYNKQIIKELKSELSFIEKTIKHYKFDKIDSIYEKLNDGRKSLVTPISLTKEQYITNWLAKEYKPNPFYEKPIFKTDCGIFVRSKSEVMIANALFKAKIPFRYEYPLKINNSKSIKTFYPDFLCLKKNSKKEIIWEHFGFMDNPEYCDKTVKKINEYCIKGFVSGENIIFTFENSETPLTPQVIDQMIKKYLL